jgi:hypothetical protein
MVVLHTDNRLQSIDESVVSSLGLVVAVVEKRVVRSSPRVLVRDTPDSDADTLGDLETSVHDSEVIAGSGTSNVKLGDGNLLDVGSSKGLEGGGESRGWVPATGGSKMGLRTDTVDGDTLRHPFVDLLDHSAGKLSVVGVVEVVVVDVQLGGGISGASSAEGNTDEVLAEDSTKDAITERAVLSKDLVDNVPLEDLALVAGDHGLDVVLDNGGQSRSVADVLDPLGQLRVPEQGVSSDQLAIGLGEVDDLVSVGEAERVSAGLNGIPLHAVLRGNLTELPLHDGDERVVVEMVVVDLSTEVELALGLELSVEASSCIAASSRRGSGRLSWLRVRVGAACSGNTLEVVVVDLLTLQAGGASCGTIPSNATTLAPDRRLGYSSHRSESEEKRKSLHCR